MVLERKARRHYGVRCNESWDETRHSPDNKFWCELEEEWKAKRQMFWFIRKGQAVVPDSPASFPFFSKDDDYRGPGTALYVCDADEAPEEYSRDIVRKLCDLRTEVTTLPRSQWKRKVNSVGKAYKVLGYNYCIAVESASLRFSCEIDEVSYGSVGARFE